MFSRRRVVSIGGRLFLSYLGVVAVGLIAASLTISGVLRRYEEARLSMRYHARHAPHVGGDDGTPRRHRLEQGHRRSLRARRECEDIHRREQPWHVAAPAREDGLLRQAQVTC